VKLHDLKPAPGSHKKRQRVGRGIAAGQGKTAGRGTKGQKARAGGTIPAWFEGGQTPLHQRLPKLRGFKNAFRIEYEIVNVGDVARLVEAGVLESGELPAAAKAGATKSKAKAAKAASSAPVTVNQEILRATGLVRTLDRPLKILGGGELSTALFVVADAFSASARTKIEAAGGTANVIEATGRKTPPLGVSPEAKAPATDAAAAGPSEAPLDVSAEAPAEPSTEASVEPQASVEPETPAAPEAPAPEAKAAPAKPATRRRKAAAPAEESTEAGDAG